MRGFLDPTTRSSKKAVMILWGGAILASGAACAFSAGLGAEAAAFGLLIGTLFTGLVCSLIFNGTAG